MGSGADVSQTMEGHPTWTIALTLSGRSRASQLAHSDPSQSATSLASTETKRFYQHYVRT